MIFQNLVKKKAIISIENSVLFKTTTETNFAPHVRELFSWD